MNLIKRAWLWLITKHQKENLVSEPLSDVVSSQSDAITPASNPTPVSTVITPSSEVKDGVHDFEAALHFVRDGVKKLGDAAEDELIALAKKYL